MPRVEYPIAYWIVLALYVEVVAMWVRFLGAVAIDVMRNG
jgi:hypothetical protein